MGQAIEEQYVFTAFDGLGSMLRCRFSFGFALFFGWAWLPEVVVVARSLVVNQPFGICHEQ